MLSDSSSNPDQLQIKQDGKFFSRLMSKETSMANSSSRVYYGGASGAVPFMWESEPGTPKHPSSDTALPPLTPPPSYQSSSKSKSKQKKTLFSSIFSCQRKNHANSPSSSSTSTSSSTSSSLSSWSSFHCSASSQSANYSSNKNRKLFQYRRRSANFSCSRSQSVHNFMDDDNDEEEEEEKEEGLRSSPSSTLCFGLKRRNLKKFIRG